MTARTENNIPSEKPVDAGVILIPVLVQSDSFDFVSTSIIQQVDPASLIDDGVIFIPILGVDGDMERPLGIMQSVEPVLEYLETLADVDIA